MNALYWPGRFMTRTFLVAALLGGLVTQAGASSLFDDNVGDVLRGETFSAEAMAGYVTAASTEYVHDPVSGAKLSQLNWNISNAFAVGGRVAIRPLDWLTVRVRGWSTVVSDSGVRDYDWRAGYFGFASYTDLSVHPDTVSPQAWSGDASLAATVYQDDNLGLSIIGGYRYYQTKFAARGGSYTYSTFAFRDTTGTFPSGETVGTYRQTWRTPYLGVGFAVSRQDWTFTGELYGSPIVEADANDNHILRTLNIRSRFGYSNMIGINSALEYRFADHLSVVGRVEWQHFQEARGSATYTDSSTGTAFVNPSPGSGADASTLLFALGLKARL